MKRAFKNLFFSVFVFATLFVTGTRAQEDIPLSEQITLFKSEVVLEQNTDIHIKEEIHYFFPSSRRGIIREIPVDYKIQAGFKRPTTLILNEIYYFKKDQPERTFSQYERSSKSGYAIFKIGDPDTTIQGGYVYVIEYTLRNAINYFDEYDELYLNLTGNGWDVPIRSALAEIKVPGEITDKLCFSGPIDSTESNCSFEDISENEVKIEVDTELQRFEGYTVVLKMPKGTLDDTTGRQRLAFLLSNIGILLPIPVFFFLLNLVNKKGKNKKLTIIPHYEPREDISPLFAAYVYKGGKVDNKNITSEIIQLAIDGHIKIRQEKRNKYILEKDNVNKEIKFDLPSTLYSGLFKGKDSVDTKKIPSDFYLTVQKLNIASQKKAYDEKYFDKKRKNLKGRLLVLGMLAISGSIFIVSAIITIAATGWLLGLFISSVLFIIFSFKVDLKSKKGNELYHELEGLKMYINTAEKHRIEFHNDPEKFRGVFETLLPYAIIFGLEKKWAKEFEDIYKEPPSWYQGDVSTFNSYLLASSIAGIDKNVKTRAVSPNSAGGFTSSHGGSGGSGFSGGSSGGGFGGGGGSSW